MLTSIHPLGERARHNPWTVTVTALVLGAVGAGAVLGALLGAVGSLFPGGNWRWAAAVGAMVAAGAGDLAGLRPPGPRRQVNEDWIGAFRGWVYGGAFGVQLGSGVATYVVTWAVWATAILAVLVGSAPDGALIGAAFGLGRSAFPLTAGWIDRPSRLTTFSRTLASIAAPVARGVGVCLLIIGMLAGSWKVL